jgi:hypothetical protein
VSDPKHFHTTQSLDETVSQTGDLIQGDTRIWGYGVAAKIVSVWPCWRPLAKEVMQVRILSAMHGEIFADQAEKHGKVYPGQSRNASTIFPARSSGNAEANRREPYVTGRNGIYDRRHI